MPASQHQSPKSDIEISQAAKKIPIMEIARERLGIAAENLDPYGHYKAKVSMDYIKSIQSRPNGKLILVTAITPTPAGEGKTTTTVGLTDALNLTGKKAMLCLREPSLGPSFGMKGGRGIESSQLKNTCVKNSTRELAYRWRASSPSSRQNIVVVTAMLSLMYSPTGRWQRLMASL